MLVRISHGTEELHLDYNCCKIPAFLTFLKLTKLRLRGFCMLRLKEVLILFGCICCWISVRCWCGSWLYSYALHSLLLQAAMSGDLQVIKANDDLTPEHHQFFLYQMLRGLKYIHTGIVSLHLSDPLRCFKCKAEHRQCLYTPCSARKHCWRVVGLLLWLVFTIVSTAANGFQGFDRAPP